MPGLLPETVYDLAWEGPVEHRTNSHTSALAEHGPSGGAPVTGAALAEVGLWLPRCRPETIRLIHVTARP